MIRSARRCFRMLLLATIAAHGLSAPSSATAQSCTGPLSGLWVLLAAAPTALSCTLIDCDSECRCRTRSGSTPIPLGGGITIPVATPICHDGGTLFGQDIQSGVTNTLSGTVEPGGRAGIVDDFVRLTQVTRATVSTGTSTTTVSATGMVVEPGLFGMPVGVTGDWQRHDEFVNTAERCVSGPITTCTAAGRFNTLIIASPRGLSLTKDDSPDPVVAGHNLTYTLTVTNRDQTDATGVVLKDDLPDVTLVSVAASQGNCREAGQAITCDLGTLPGGATATVTIVVKPSAAGIICNRATVKGNEADPNPNDNAATECTTVTADPLPLTGGADLSVTKTHRPDPVPVDGCLTYQIEVTNRGPLVATGVTLTDTLPDSVRFVSATSSQGHCSRAGRVVTCDLGSIQNQAVATVTIVVEPTTPTEITNTATAHGNEPDVDLQNNTATVTTTVAATMSLAPELELALNQRSFRPGDTFIAESRVRNPGPSVTADFYFAALLSDQTLIFLTPGGSAVGRPTDPCTFRPRFSAIVIPHTCEATVIDRLSFVVSAAEPTGSHLLVSALTKPDAFADCAMDPGDVFAIAVEPFSIAP